MNEIKTVIVNFLDGIPPLLQLIFGISIAIMSVKIIIMVADYIDARKEK